MKLIVLALVFKFVISCWPKTNIVSKRRFNVFDIMKLYISALDHARPNKIKFSK